MKINTFCRAAYPCDTQYAVHNVQTQVQLIERNHDRQNLGMKDQVLILPATRSMLSVHDSWPRLARIAW